MFSFSGHASRTTLHPRLPKPTLRYSPTNGWFFYPPLTTSSFTTIDPFGLTNIRQPPVDLELRLGQVGHTISYQEAMKTRKATKRTNNHRQVAMDGVPKDLALTLGYQTWLSSYIRRGRPMTVGSGTRTRTRTRTRRSDGSNKNEPKRHDHYELDDLDLNKEQADDDDDDDDEVRGRSCKRKRDYYGPCVRCGRVFDMSQRYASHMRIHYQMEETEEEKMARLAKKRKR